MLNKKVPLRMCVACKTSKPKKDLIRIVRNDEGYLIDKTGKLNGRGSYICNDPECINKLIKQKILNKVLKINIGQDVYDRLKEQFFENREN